MEVKIFFLKKEQNRASKHKRPKHFKMCAIGKAAREIGPEELFEKIIAKYFF